MPDGARPTERALTLPHIPNATSSNCPTSRSDIVSQGLRTLELCVDNLTQEFLPVAETEKFCVQKPSRVKQVDVPSLLPTNQIRRSSKEVSLFLPWFNWQTRLMRRGRHSLQKEWVWILKKHHARVFVNGEREETFLFAQGVVLMLLEFRNSLAGPNPEQARYSLSLTNTIIDALIDNLTVATDQNHLQAASQFTHRVFQKLFQTCKNHIRPQRRHSDHAKRTLGRKASSSCTIIRAS
ncbi:hypothetical protein PGTUg99_009822 [Puccinia graminis f. sp. tritici]|uniref:Uncharacterized protein n=1 Tax=Puccinia graminis f. sp. tritici TaxID=56615 RepID=A0A5B0PS41_PUCGR|nr:hypothetical protein PGTUg99_009822 [Puccinia graminis f. sp. tritici]